MTSDRELLVHLAGYASITAVLASAGWVGVLGKLLTIPILLGTLYLGGRLLVEELVSRARRLDSSGPETVATDGGVEGGDE